MGWAWWKRLRPLNLLIVACTQLFFIYIVLVPQLGANIVSSHIQFDLWIIVFITLCLTAGGYVINDLKDVEIDRINKPDRVILDTSRWLWVYRLLFTIGALATIYISYLHDSWWYLATYLIAWYALYAYSDKLKCKPLWGNLLVSLFSASVVIAVLGPFLSHILHLREEALIRLLRPFIFYFLFAFLLSLIREIVKDMEDTEGDKSRACKTLAASIGDEKSKVFVLFFSTVFVLSMSAWIVRFYTVVPIFFLSYLLLCVFIPILVIMLKIPSIKGSCPQRKKSYGQISLWLKYIMIVGILALSMELYIK